jgi:5-(carboxyamino)imidazole ribonucleotide synthase
VAAAKFLEQRLPVYPPSAALEQAQDRLREKRLFRKLGIPVTEFAEVAEAGDLDAAVKQVGLPAILKTCRMGYDGKGQWLLQTATDIKAALPELPGVPLILEKYVPFTRELSVLGVRGRYGEIAFYPLIENHHRGGILRLSLAPAPHLASGLQVEAETAARAVLETLGYVGVLCIEFFEVNGRLLANEMAPRVHNSGHWTIEGAEASQFENHLRAILGLPLGSTTPVGVSAMLNLIGETPESADVLKVANAHLHLYGKEPRSGRKLGHLTVRAEQTEKLQQRLATLPQFFLRPEFCLEKALPELLAKRA